MVDATEVRNDYGDGKSYYKHTTKWTNATDNLSSNRFRYLNIWQVEFIVFAWLPNITHHVTITQSRHCNNCVPESGWNWRKVRTVNIFFSVEHDRGEYNDCHSKWKDKKAQLGSAWFQSVAQNSQALRVTREFEDSKNSKHSQRYESAWDIVIVLHEQPYVIWHDGYNINHTHHTSHKSASVGCRKKTEQVLGSENHHASRVKTEEYYFVSFTTRKCSSTSRSMTTGN